MTTTTTSNGATVDNLNVLDTSTTDGTAIELQEVANALFPTTNATQTLTIDRSFWTDNLTLTFQVGNTGVHYTLAATSLDNFTRVQSDSYGNASPGALPITFSANS